MSEPDMKAQKAMFFAMIALMAVCVVGALTGIYAHVTLRQVWGLPLFIVSMLTGFGGQIAFIVGLARANRPQKGF